MNHMFGRRTTTMAATLAVAATTLLAVGGTASATSDPSVDRTADASHSSSITVQYGGNRGGDRDRDRESSNRRIDRGSSDLYVYDSHRRWERNDNKWHHNNGDQLGLLARRVGGLPTPLADLAVLAQQPVHR
ncbi:hypothetical protein ACGFZ9_51520, partial [Streptomyces mirabilis]